MKKAILMAGLALAACGTGAYAQPKNTANIAPLQSALAANFDRLFVIHGTMGNLGEVALGKLAMTHTKNPDVLAVARMTMKEHGAAQKDLAAAAKASGYPIPNNPGPVNMAFAEKLAKLRGAAFDKMYLAGQVGAHEQTVVLLQHEIEHGRNSRVKAYAQNKLPGILGHTAMIYTVAGKVKAPGSELRPAPVKQAANNVAMQMMNGMKMGGM